MAEKNLPIKVVMQKTSDSKRNKGGGGVKFFGEVTPALQNDIAKKFQEVFEYYKDIFAENEHIPAVGKIIVKPEAIAKSHKPNDLCRKCEIIGSDDLDEIYFKVTKKTILETVQLIKNPPSERFRANLTAISDIKPIKTEDKIAEGLVEIVQQGNFDSIKAKIKIKIFDFADDFDNSVVINHIMTRMSQYGLFENAEIITYGEAIKFIKVNVSSYDDVIKIASINGVKSVDFFQEYSLPTNESVHTDLMTILEDEYSDSEMLIGIIDGGISTKNAFIAPYIYAQETYVSKIYQNPSHATFIASTILYGNKLNGIVTNDKKRFKFVDIIAMPNGDKDFGPVDAVSENELMEIIEETMIKYAGVAKVWNVSLGIPKAICKGKMSDLGIFFDYIQDKYGVQIFVSSGNLTEAPLRTWPQQATMGERDRIISPADSVRAITVGSVALYDSANSIVRKNEPSPFSRRGPGANYIVKPDVVDYGGNIDYSHNIEGHGIKGLDVNGNVIEGIGTSYSNPRVVQKFSSVYDELVEKDLLLAKAMIIHSARMSSRDLLDQNQDNIKYYGFGMPEVDCQNILQCSEDEITLVFRQKVNNGTHLEMFDFPFPPSLIRKGKYYGQIGMTLVYNPILDDRYGREYCRTNIDAHFGTYKYQPDGKVKFTGCVPLESSWDEKFEQSRVENGFKWSPIKSYYRNIPNGINVTDGWKIRIDLTERNGLDVPMQEFVLIVTIKDSEGHDIYSEVVNGLRSRGYVTNNLETRQQIRQRRGK